MTETQQLYEVTVGCGLTKRKEIVEWAVQTFGDQVDPHETLPILYFCNEADVAFFMLRWS
jgi:hypothetical protein